MTTQGYIDLAGETFRAEAELLEQRLFRSPERAGRSGIEGRVSGLNDYERMSGTGAERGGGESHHLTRPAAESEGDAPLWAVGLRPPTANDKSTRFR
jgi:hypothetical protein